MCDCIKSTSGGTLGTRRYPANEVTCLFPNINLIEHVWDALGRRNAACPNAPVTLEQLSTAPINEWNAPPQELITNLVESMGLHCRACIAVHGDHTSY
ncbi:unnamed protein product [Haemonchus placei]|uniref:AMP-binding domain-containing protein n=1 Tax=Haemonchus placei TaxID=6290 RepID=A0A0N4WB90_HAEPC|nr:unnamed protein product [Haemonchus placei]